MPEHKSRLHREYYRNGDSHRGGADVSFQDVLRLFHFKSIHIGRWVTAQEQQLAANLFFDALCDLMDILQVPENVISLNGSLSLAFGVGGQKHAAAHYNSAKRQLALAKNAGGGALAHEWFHAFDHYISNKMFNIPVRANQFASQIWLEGQHVINTHPLNIRLAKCFAAIMLDEQGASPSSLMRASIAADSHLKTYYFAMPQEVSARAFEACIQAHQIKNAFLVQGTLQSTEAKMGIYPQVPQKQHINLHLHDYFSCLGRALDG